MHPAWIIVISIIISTILSFFMINLSRNGLKHELEMERFIREQLRDESDKRELEAILIQILEYPVTSVKEESEENQSTDIDDDSSTEW